MLQIYESPVALAVELVWLIQLRKSASNFLEVLESIQDLQD